MENDSLKKQWNGLGGFEFTDSQSFRRLAIVGVPGGSRRKLPEVAGSCQWVGSDEVELTGVELEEALRSNGKR